MMGDWDPEELRAMRGFFLEEARDHLAEIDAALAALKADPNDRGPLDALLRKLHTLKGSAGSVDLEELGRAAHALEDQAVALRRGDVTAELLDTLLAGADRLAAMVARADAETRTPAPHDAPREDSGLRRMPVPPGEMARSTPLETIRVEIDRIDDLVESGSELVFDRTRISRRVQDLEGCVRDVDKVRSALLTVMTAFEAAKVPATELGDLGEVATELSDVLASLSLTAQGAAEDAEGLRRTSTRLQDGLKRVRMMEVGRLFSRLAQPVRDLARREQKRVALRLEGEDTEIDQVLVERIAEPLLHLVRNAIAHGIEPPAERRARGKAEEGQLLLRARHAGDAVEIIVSDDGAGIDLGAVRAALIQTGRTGVAAAEALDETALYETLFQPGISTRAFADDVAGRGVGLDAVNEAIRRLGGRVRVTSTPGQGATFTVQLPLATAVQQALLFKVSGQVYAVPAARVIEAVQIEAGDLRLDGVHERVLLNGQELGLVRLGALLGVPAPPGNTTRRAGLVILSDGDRFLVTCDKVIGPREIVVRALGPLLSGLPLYAGATISGAGKVQLILDVEQLAQVARTGVRAPRPRRAPGPRRILVVDDSRSIRELASLILAQAGFAVETARDGWEAWELLQDHPFDLLVTDLEMTRIDGHELLARIRQSTALPTLPVLVVSSRTGDATKERVLKEGADGFVPKPLRKRAMLDAVDAVLKAHITG
jgi:chemotaxis protein histidine kinase CheA/ActR/RegA family two-component response regulator